MRRLNKRRPVIRSELHLSGGNGHGSSNTKVRRWTNVDVQIGRDFTYADSATLGAQITINNSGLYFLTWCDLRSGGGTTYGFSRNSGAGTTDLFSVTRANIIVLYSGPNTVRGLASIVAYLNAGDLVWCHSDGSPDETDPELSYAKFVRIA